VIFLLSNRSFVPVNFWPFGGAQLALGGVVLGTLAFGFIAGLLFHLPHRISLSRRAKRAEKRVAELEARLASPQNTP
jgi:uncharacterized integral membrane protein